MEKKSKRQMIKDALFGYKEQYRESRIQARNLYKQCQGVLLVFLLMCYVVKQWIVFPLMTKVWDGVLGTIPAHYVTEKNIGVLLHYPYVPLIGLILLVLFSIITIWELSGIMLCAEYNRQGKPVNLWKLFYAAFLNIKQLRRPVNWPFFLYVLIILPITDLFSASGMLSSFSVPEYISAFINNSPVFSFLFNLLQIILFLVAVCWFYLLQGVLIQNRSFSEACRDSFHMMKSRIIRQLVESGCYSLFASIRICLLPLLITTACFGATYYCLRNFETTLPSLSYVLMRGLIPVFQSTASCLIKVAVMCYLVVNYHIFAEQMGIPQTRELPSFPIKQKRIRHFKGLGTVVLTGACLCCVGVFVLFSVSFHVDPSLMKYIDDDTQILAHKGYCTEAPENTMAAFDKAVESGTASMIELDVRESKDGVPIVIHNASLKDACGVDKEVYDLNYKKIRSYTANYNMSKEKFADCYVPTLEEVLKTYGNEIPLLIEIKWDDRTPDLPAKIVALMKKYHCTDDCKIHSGSYEALEKVKAIDKSIPCGYIIAMGTGAYYNLPCADFFSVEHTFVNGRMLYTIHQLNKQVYAWTVDDSSSISAMANVLVDGVITDDPDKVHDSEYSVEDMVHASLQQMLVQTTGGMTEDNSAYENGDY